MERPLSSQNNQWKASSNWNMIINKHNKMKSEHWNEKYDQNKKWKSKYEVKIWRYIFEWNLTNDNKRPDLKV